MVNEIIVHLGDCKTGSTSIQEALFAKNWKSKKTKLYYPSGLNHIPLAGTLFKKDLIHLKEKRFQKVYKDILKSKKDIAVLSAEHFEFVEPQVLKNAITEYFPDHVNNVRLISYVRPHADRLVSSFSERVKMRGFEGDLEDFYTKSKIQTTLNYSERFTKWRDAFGDRFTLRVMNRSVLHQNCVVRDFLHFCFGHTDFSLIREPASNQSLSLQDIAIMRYFHSQLTEVNTRAGLCRKLAAVLAENRSGGTQKIQMHKSLLIKLQERYIEDAQETDDKFLGGSVLTDALANADKKAVEVKQSLALDDNFSTPESVQIKMWATLVAEMYELEPDGFSKYYTRLRKLNIMDKKAAAKAA